MHASISVSHGTAQVISRSRFRLLGDGRLISLSTRVTALAPEHGAQVYQFIVLASLAGGFPVTERRVNDSLGFSIHGRP